MLYTCTCTLYNSRRAVSDLHYPSEDTVNQIQLQLICVMLSG